MSTAEINRRELEVIRVIVANETWLEAERRGYPVRHGDPVVQGRVAEILLNGAGAELRQRFDPACWIPCAGNAGS